jgi:hypothetical protein
MSAIIRLRLAREEIHVLLRLAQLPGMIGVEPIKPGPDGEALFNLALRTLIARGIVQIDGENLVVDQSIIGIVAASAGPDVIAVIQTHSVHCDVITTLPIQLKPGLLISHTADQGIHTFEVFEDIREIAHLAVTALRFSQDISQANVTPLRIRQSTLDRARGVRTMGEAAILQAMQHDSDDHVALQTLAHTLANSTLNASFTLLRSITEEIDGFVIVASANVLYEVTEDPRDRNWLVIRPTSTLEISRRIHGTCLTVV